MFNLQQRRRAEMAAAVALTLLGLAFASKSRADTVKDAVRPPIRLVQAQPAPAAVYRLGALVIEAPWARATPGGAKVAGGFMRITNSGTAPDRLVGGAFSAAARVEVHEMAVADGVMKMRELAAGLEIRPGETVELKPGGYHVMFMDLARQLKAGESVAGTLVFEKAGRIDVVFTVAPIGARGPRGMSH
jgi:hypothetical protein